MAITNALPVISQITSLAGTAVSAYGTYQGGQDKKKAYEYNARVAQAEGAMARQRAEREEEVHRSKLRRLMGTQRALFAAAGVEIGTGTPLEVMLDTVREGEKEAQYIKWGGETEETRYLNEAQLQRMYGESAGRAGTIGGLSQFATGLGRLGTQWYKPKTTIAPTTGTFGGWD